MLRVRYGGVRVLSEGGVDPALPRPSGSRTATGGATDISAPDASGHDRHRLATPVGDGRGVPCGQPARAPLDRSATTGPRVPARPSPTSPPGSTATASSPIVIVPALTLALAFLAAPGVAPLASDATLPALIVTPGGERTGDAVLEDHVGTHSRIGPERLARRDVALDDVLAQEAGVQSRRVGGFGSFASITVRAASPAQTALLLDGVRLDSAGSPVVDLSTLDLLALDDIDVYRGVTPLQFGSGGMGGAVNLVTPRVAGGEPVTRLGLGAASFGTVRAELAHRARRGRWDTVAAASALSSENDYPFVDGNGTPLNPDDDRRERRNNAAVRRVGLLGKIGTAHGETSRTDLLVQLGERRLGVPEWRNAEENDARFDTGTRQVQLSHVRDAIGAWDSAHTAYLHAENDRFDDRDSEVGLGAQDTSTRSRTLGLDSFWTRPLGIGTFDARASLRRETLARRDQLDAGSDVDARRHLLRLATRWSAYALDGRLVVAPALRVEASEDEFDRIGSRTRDERDTRRASTLSPELGLRFDRSEALSWHASLGRHVREPAFSELFVGNGLTRGNPDLVAEEGLNADVGVTWSKGSALSLAAALFASERDELIVTVFDSRGIGRAINTGRARILGAELSGAWAPGARWRVSGNATWQDAANLSDNPVLDARQLPGEARLELHAALRYRPAPRWQLRLEADATRDRHYDQANRRPARDATTTNLGLDYTRGPAPRGVLDREPRRRERRGLQRLSPARQGLLAARLLHPVETPPS